MIIVEMESMSTQLEATSKAKVNTHLFCSSTTGELPVSLDSITSVTMLSPAEFFTFAERAK